MRVLFVASIAILIVSGAALAQQGRWGERSMRARVSFCTLSEVPFHWKACSKVLSSKPLFGRVTNMIVLTL